MGLFNTLVPSIPIKNIIYSSVLSTFTQSISTNTHISTLDISITVAGTKPIWLELRPVLSETLAGRPGLVGFTGNTTSPAVMTVQLVRNGSLLPFTINTSQNLISNAGVRTQRWSPGTFVWLDTVAPAGAVSYQIFLGTTNCTAIMQGLQLVATEVV